MLGGIARGARRAGAIGVSMAKTAGRVSKTRSGKFAIGAGVGLGAASAYRSNEG